MDGIVEVIGGGGIDQLMQYPVSSISRECKPLILTGTHEPTSHSKSGVE